MSGAPNPVDTVVLDLDGTLVDSVYQHVAAWQAAFRDVGLVVPGWRLHPLIGMGGDRLVTAATGEAAERAVGDQARDLQAKHFDERIHEVRALDGAAELLRVLQSSNIDVVLASSGQLEVTERLLTLVEGAESLSAKVTGSEVDRSKPSPDLIDLAMQRVRAETAIVIGDAVWDVEAANAQGVPCIALRSGGAPEAALRNAGAAWIFDDPQDLVDHLGETPLGRSA